MKRINTSVPYLSKGEKRPPSFHTTSLRVKTAAVADHNKEVLRQMEETHYKGGAECEINRPEQPALIVTPSSLCHLCAGAHANLSCFNSSVIELNPNGDSGNSLLHHGNRIKLRLVTQ